jgi:membrane protein YdbS with pleckstrin-like domain
VKLRPFCPWICIACPASVGASLWRMLSLPWWCVAVAALLVVYAAMLTALVAQGGHRSWRARDAGGTL